MPLFGQHCSSALLFSDNIQVLIKMLGLNLSIGGPVQLMNANDEIWSQINTLLFEETISFIELKVRSHSAEEIAKVFIAVINGSMSVFSEG